MDIISVRAVHGPNVYSANPVLIVKLDLKSLTDTPSKDISGFNEKLKNKLPGLIEHTCSEGHRGGFYERLALGTYLGHIIEHIAIELSQLAGIAVNFGKTVFAGEYGFYNVVVGFKNEEGMRHCLKSAFLFADNLIHEKDFDLDQCILEIKKTVQLFQLGATTQTVLDAAIKRGIPWKKISPDLSLFQLGYGKNRKFFQAAASNHTSLIAADMVQDKFLTKAFLNRNFFPTPAGFKARSLAELSQSIYQLSPPFVVKPIDGNHGRGVVLDLVCPIELESAFIFAKKFSNEVLIEEMCWGNDYRVLIMSGKVVAAAHRKPATVVGDGFSTIEELIEQKNAEPGRGEGHLNSLTKIVLDEAALTYLAKKQISLVSIPKKNEMVSLRGNANLSTGGTAIDVTHAIHPEIKALSERAARVVNLDICGIDLIHSEISQPVNKNTKIIEINAAPGLRMHLQTADGHPCDIGGAVIETLYPNQQNSRIPIVSVTGSNGKTTVSRLIHHILSGDGSTVGLAVTDGIWIGKEKIVSGDTTGPRSADVVLSDPKIEIAVLESARGGLIRGGLAYDWSDVGVITNIKTDHIGQDGIESTEDLIWIKSLIAERVRPNGTLVINADDPAALSVLLRSKVQSVPKNIFLYSSSKFNSDLNDHIMKGGSGCWVDSGQIYVKNADCIHQICDIKNIPITLNGIIDFQISNALAAVSACVGLGAEISQIIAGLKDFFPSKSNIGRLSLYQIQKGLVILDYAHNPAALSSICKVIDQSGASKKTAVIGLPGDRNNKLLTECAEEIALSFQKFIIKEDDDLRGRNPGEVSEIIETAIMKKNSRANCVRVSIEKNAIFKALENLQAEDIVVIFYDKLETALGTLSEFDPKPLQKMPLFLDTETTKRNHQHSFLKTKKNDQLKNLLHGML